MRKSIVMIAVLFALLVCHAYAAEYAVAAPDTQLFGKPTSIEPVTVVGVEDNGNIDRSKNTALAPPAFGGATASLPGSGAPMTYGTGIPATVSAVYTPPAAYTAITDSLLYSGGYVGTLEIQSINLSVRVYEGTDSTALAKGAGHFPATSIWDGNIAIAGHNRGVNNHFGKIHTLQAGDIIRFTTKLGTRSYAVYSVQSVSEYDTSGLNPSGSNRLTLYTCVMNQSELRWCVRAIEV